MQKTHQTCEGKNPFRPQVSGLSCQQTGPKNMSLLDTSTTNAVNTKCKMTMNIRDKAFTVLVIPKKHRLNQLIHKQYVLTFSCFWKFSWSLAASCLNVSSRRWVRLILSLNTGVGTSAGKTLGPTLPVNAW